jgi:hypothetical protein
MSPQTKVGRGPLHSACILVALPLVSLLASTAFSQDAPAAPLPATPVPVAIRPTIVPDTAAASPTAVAVPSLAGTPAVHKESPASPPAKVPAVVAVPSLAGTPADTTPVAPPIDPQQPAAPATAVATIPPAPPAAFTFGFSAGETRDQIIAAIGKDAVIKTDGDILEVKSAPVPAPAFDSFLLIVGPKQGLVKIIASGVDIDGDSEGKQMKLAFGQMRDGIKAAYGEPSDNFDFLKADSTLKKPSQFMLALTNNERTLATYWTKRSFLNNITSIALEGNGLGNDKGYISLEIEFLPYRDYILTRKPQ